MSNEAVFQVLLPSGGHFRASWPQDASAQALQLAHSMLNLNVEYWIDAKQQIADGEKEYASWFAHNDHGARNFDRTCQACAAAASSAA